MYYEAFSAYRVFVRLLVFALYILQVAQVILVTQNEFLNFGTKFGNLNSVDQVGTAWIFACVIEGIGEPQASSTITI